MRAYWDLLQNPALRRLYLLGLLIRTPLAGGALLITLHVVARVDPRYSVAGVVAGGFTLAAAVASPWRGRMLDEAGLRRTLLPTLLVLPAVWAIAPWVPFWPLLALVVVGGALQTPIYPLVRQGIANNTAGVERRTALSLDSVLIEVSWTVGPLLAVALATYWNTAWALMTMQLVAVAATAVLWWLDPPVGAVRDGEADAAQRRVPWVGVATVTTLGLMAVTAVTFAGGTVGSIAALKAWGQDASIGWVTALWSIGSGIGGLLYGLVRRQISPAWMLFGLALTLAPCALARNDWTLGLLFLGGGIFAAPAIAAGVELLSTLVHSTRVGEVMGWHGAMGTVGNALGSPLIGAIIDRWGWGSGFLVTAVFGCVCAVIGAVLLRGASTHAVRSASHG